MQGQINPKGHLQGSINPTGNLQGTMSTESLIGGQVVGMRGLKGEQGDVGETGNGIASAVLNDDYTLTLTFTDGTSYTTTSIRGAKGEDGIVGRDGTSIDTISKTSTSGLTDTYTITLTDGATHTFEVTNGQDGADGEDGYTPVKGVDYFDGADGKDGVNGQDGYTPIKGVDYFDGADGKDGKDGTNGTDGQDGNGISSISKTGTVGLVDTYTITFTNGTTTTFTVTNGQDGQGSGDMTKAVYDTDNDGIVDQAESVDWSGVTNKPSIPSKTSDLTNDSNFVSNTDYATDSTGGVIKTAYSVKLNGEGRIYCDSISLASYSAKGDVNFISKGTLENIGDDFVSRHKGNLIDNTYHDSSKQDVIDSSHKLDYSLLSNTPTIPTVPTNVSAFTNDSGYITSSYHDSSKADTSHTQSASTITGGTLGGGVVANSTAVGTLGTAQVRNITISSSEPTSADGNDGDIWIVYEGV